MPVPARVDDCAVPPDEGGEYLELGGRGVDHLDLVPLEAEDEVAVGRGAAGPGAPRQTQPALLATLRTGPEAGPRLGGAHRREVFANPRTSTIRCLVIFLLSQLSQSVPLMAVSS